MATLHAAPKHDIVPNRSHRAGAGQRPVSRGRTRSGLLGVAIGAFSLVLNVVGISAVAAPGGEEAAQSALDAATAEVRRIEGLLAQAEEDVARYTVEAEAAADATAQAQRDLVAAQGAAEAAAAQLAAATAAVEGAREQIADLGRESYMTGDSFGSAAAFLGSNGPEDVLQRAVILDLLGADRAEALADFRAIEAEQAAADEAARAAVAERDRAAGAAAEAEAAADTRLTQAEAAYEQAHEQQAQYQSQLRLAELALLAAQGADDPEAAWAADVNAERAEEDAAAAATAAAAASGQAVAPTTGRITSCYGSRWGAMHYGMDIAASIGTPIYTPAAGRVLQAGPANGFGLAVYIQHEDGSVTVYGHINAFFVTAGQQVAAGQRIAEVGNRGQSTGPHLHFEVHAGGLYKNRVNPVPWLSARGVSLGGGC